MMRPPELVDATYVSAPSGDRTKRDEVDGSKVMGGEEFRKISRPANVPVRPTVPMRSKSTCGRMAKTRFMARERTRNMDDRVVGIMISHMYPTTEGRLDSMFWNDGREERTR